MSIGHTYRNSEAAKQFTCAIAKVERSVVAKEIDSAQFISILSDGLTDSSITEQELFFARYVIDRTPVVRFLASIYVES